MATLTSDILYLGKLAPSEAPTYLPYVDASVPCGFPSPASDYEAEDFDLNSYFVRNRSATFAVKMQGEALIDAGIMPNDILIVDRSLDPKPGDLLLVFYEGDYLVRRYHLEGNQPTLHPENANGLYSVITPTPDDQFTIEGVITGLGRRY